jgi:PadR family transcriptional regulator PadR
MYKPVVTLYLDIQCIGDQGMPINKELFKGCTKTIVLQQLSRKKMHGYEIASSLKELSSGEITLTEGTLYPVLHSLAADEYIEASWETSAGERKRKVYKITDKGTRLLQAKTKEWRHFLSAMELILPNKERTLYAQI